MREERKSAPEKIKKGRTQIQTSQKEKNKMIDMQIEEIKVKEIIELHAEIIDHFSAGLEKAIRIGELLIEQKNMLGHGEFISWIEKNLPFTDRTARNYMRLHRNKNEIKTENVSDLNSAYKMLAPPPEATTCQNPDGLDEPILEKGA